LRGDNSRIDESKEKEPSDQRTKSEFRHVRIFPLSTGFLRSISVYLNHILQ
jgi:hypothetical protein